MKRASLLLTFLFALALHASAQTTLTDEQWMPLYKALETEDFDAAEKLSSKYLAEIKEQAGDFTLPRLRYMYLYSAAGRIAAGKMTYDELEKKIKDLAGKEIFLPARIVVEKCQEGVHFNGICKGESYDIMVTSTNRAATSIHAFEYITLKEKLDFAANNGKAAAIVGTIQKIVPNPNKSRALVMRIFIVDGTVMIREAPSK